MALMQDMVENDIFEWETEEEIVRELIDDVFLKGEKLEEVHHVRKEANSVIAVATKIDKEDPSMKRAKYTRTMTLPSSSASTHTVIAPLPIAEPQNSPHPDLLNIAQRAKMHDGILTLNLKILKDIPSPHT
ncbi:hypothetical protein HAX54_047845 [Datura stramonium]|uniref:Uncharacterized protein n=1 Tax=Datura stramonium TaxID=4076 RepID=A0ABS8WLH5_DATST|nr:hypothetical protein [Datura stramonium]